MSPLFSKWTTNTGNLCTCIATGKSSAKSGGKKRSACFLVNDGFPVNRIITMIYRRMNIEPQNDVQKFQIKILYFMNPRLISIYPSCIWKFSHQVALRETNTKCKAQLFFPTGQRYTIKRENPTEVSYNVNHVIDTSHL